MSARNHAAPSLWWKLTWQLSLVLLAAVATVTLGLCIYGAFILSPNVGLKDRVAHALDDSLMRDQHGRLVVVEGPNLRQFQAENGGLWFIAAAQDGQVVVYGDIPVYYAGMGPFVRLIRDADIRGASGTEDEASIDAIETRLGEIRVMYGGNTSTTNNILTMMTNLAPIYVPLLGIAVPALFLTIPRIVGRSLAGLNEAVRMAPEIDARRGGSRLPVNNVPKEVAPLIMAFNSILERLELQFQTKQRFLIDAAHELRTPIAIMQTRIEGLSEDSERRRLMADVARLAETAEQLLDFERNEQSTDVHRPVNLVDIARSVVADLAPLAIAAGYEISFDSDTLQVLRDGSHAALERAISNLVRNAIDHGGNAGTILVTVSRHGEIAVCDDGPGIPLDHRDLVFEPFYRLAPRSTGAGLGLSLVKQIVADHHGKVSIESATSGTLFKIRL
ncbi:HAMP domain-containing sensor histidine kinase [Neorhizobium sp. JUb45]|uniref:sensor histidine kinase n=1 Tax=Neorhizobium sp. JUb45 TaxID=2485113 RepID=UPI00104C8448|nr:HAMP domain-containing sensor histidine kinase [Neorhizobium sp. JUb45]TCQ97338.1 signal transduction histidine kinase [Neorhizobium sp. JUb45]